MNYTFVKLLKYYIYILPIQILDISMNLYNKYIPGMKGQSTLHIVLMGIYLFGIWVFVFYVFAIKMSLNIIMIIRFLLLVMI